MIPGRTEFEAQFAHDLAHEGSYQKQDRNPRIGDPTRMVIFQRVTWIHDGHGRVQRLEFRSHPPAQEVYWLTGPQTRAEALVAAKQVFDRDRQGNQVYPLASTSESPHLKTIQVMDGNLYVSEWVFDRRAETVSRHEYLTGETLFWDISST